MRTDYGISDGGSYARVRRCSQRTRFRQEGLRKPRRARPAPARGGRRRYGTMFFFFQAEDGIRDYKVTGVQTCALPILWIELQRKPHAVSLQFDPPLPVRPRAAAPDLQRTVQCPGQSGFVEMVEDESREIGRASCRERV